MTTHILEMKNRTLLLLMYGIFSVSGFTGLIYESIWSHYLKLFLGHAAYAQTLVLAIFMGGMALGAWLSSLYSCKWKNLFFAYAIIEFIIGLAAIFFHPLFESAISSAYNNIIPSLGSAASVTFYKWSLSAILILPQSILLGMTFPIMSAGILRRFPELPGNKIAMLYFTNSIGATIGVIISGFVLIKFAGLPGTIQIAGVINIILALTVFILIKNNPSKSETKSPETGKPVATSFFSLLCAISLLTGTASFIYEISWIRMLSLVLGSSTHAFELMLSAFILGIALGGLWIKRRIDSLSNSMNMLANIQIIMGILALSTLPLYGNTFEIMRWLLSVVPKTDFGYTLFNLSSHLIAICIMLPTTFFAGMTLPVITFTLLKKGGGEKSIGIVYATNTIGAIIGIIFAIHIGLPVFGLKGLIIFGASIDIILGVVLLLWLTGKHFDQLPRFRTSLPVLAIVFTLLFVNLDTHKMASGVYRMGDLLSSEDFDIIYHQDGKTATVDLTRGKDGVVGIRTNGKVDASINLLPNGLHTADEATMVLAAAIPLALNPQAKVAANIGLGSGLTTHTLLLADTLEQVDSIEIEAAMVEAAKIFRPKVELAYTSNKGKIVIDDAKTFFSNQKSKYDIIISEPSNPWVSGTASLFTDEFYRHVNHYLEDDGLLVQWIQLYEIDTNLVASVLKSLSLNYSDYVIYACNVSDILIIATQHGEVPELNPHIFKQPNLAKELSRINFTDIQDIQIRKIASKKILEPYLETLSAPANSDYYPYLDQNAARARFLNKNALELIQIADHPLPIIDILEGNAPVNTTTKLQANPYFPKTERANNASNLLRLFTEQSANTINTLPQQLQLYLQMAAPVIRECDANHDITFWQDTIFNNIALALIPYLSPIEMQKIWNLLEADNCWENYSDIQKLWIRLLKSISNHNSSEMTQAANLLLRTNSIKSSNQLNYVLTAAMLGHIANNENKQAIDIWESNREIFVDSDQSLVMDVLLSHSRKR